MRWQTSTDKQLTYHRHTVRRARRGGHRAVHDIWLILHRELFTLRDCGICGLLGSALMYSISAMQQQIASCESTILIIEQLQTHTNLLQQLMSQTQTSLQNQNAIDLLEQKDSLIRRTVETTQRQMDVLSAEPERIEEMSHLDLPGKPAMEEQLLIGTVKQSINTLQPVIPTITTTFRASVPRNVYVKWLSNLCILLVIRYRILIEQSRYIPIVEMIHMMWNVD
ncbi:uncharacterized protein MONOS_15703 [Monocercomonoides exilis]|uniref:uncharacterized protein n=1 Tax=Monocercomonoides exilis TaxID=2049356 RepID=UPI00355A7A6B|nr:hypothetical protein MONOS_15703 [Monocercomonoides exilis]|eukprot:MONOS_15703.1-p1 / transcript=MONOS_15703.1 / gene=MONOS_15703 / organism=Monocercomonoides_exilis_PA203 / gene_product=unspecified product / transcript_product=unspecified product / location=Mono_scaffold01317:6131-6802(-) / protein_length=224 / sequence_SO=supercontig / SO=protein_coding / is_pseudo=false